MAESRTERRATESKIKSWSRSTMTIRKGIEETFSAGGDARVETESLKFHAPKNPKSNE
jgi:hypothetical protein